MKKPTLEEIAAMREALKARQTKEQEVAGQTEVEQTAEEAELARRDAAKGAEPVVERPTAPETPPAIPVTEEEPHPYGERVYSPEEEEEIYGPKKEQKIEVPEEPHPYGERPYTKEEEEEIYRVKAEKEKTEKDLLLEKLDSAREACADNLYQKDKLARGVERLSGWRRFFMSAEKRATRTAAEEDFKKAEESYKKSQESFKGTLKDYRVYLLKEKEAELNNLVAKRELKKEDADKQLEQYAKEKVIETTTKEAIKLFDAKENLRIQEMGVARKWLAEKTSGIAEWYRKQPTKVKIAVSIGLGIGGVAGGLAGGVPGAFILSAAFAGRTGMRVLGGMATTAGVERGMKIIQERGAEKEIGKEKEFADKFSEALKGKNDKLDDKLFEMLGRKGGQKRNRYIVAGVAGGLVGSGALAYAFQEAMHHIPESIREPILQKIGSAKEWLFGKAGVEAPVKPKVPLGQAPEMPSGKGAVPVPESPLAPEAPEISGVVTVQKGDSVWKLLEKQLESRGQFDELGGNAEEIKAAKTYMIDALKDKVVVDPKAFGLTNPDLIKPGQKIDFSRLFDDQQKLDEIFNRAQNLSESEVKNILRPKPVEIKMNAPMAEPRPEVAPEPERVAKPEIEAEIQVAQSLTESPEAPEVPEEPRTAAIPEPEVRTVARGKGYVVNLPPAPEEVSKHFVSGEEYEHLLREKEGIDKLLDESGLFNKDALEAISGQVDAAIAQTINMGISDYNLMKGINLENFIAATNQPTLFVEQGFNQAQWEPIKRTIDEYLGREKITEIKPDDLKGTVGDFFKKIIKIDVGK